MSRQGGLVILLGSVVAAVLLAWALRTPSAGPQARQVGSAGTAATPTGAPLPSEARPARVSRGQFTGGLDATVSAVPLDAILETNLAAAGLPSLQTPPARSPADGALPDDVVVVGIVVDGRARAYAADVLNRHWAVNDVLDGRRVSVLWDPVAGAAAVYQGSLDGRPVTLGASGLWLHGNALFADADTGSLLPAITGRFVTGSLADRRLRPIPFRRETWKAWVERYPDTRVVLAEADGGGAPEADPYAALDAQPQLIAAVLPQVADQRQAQAAMERVVGWVDPLDGAHCAPLQELPEAEALPVGRAEVTREGDRFARVMLPGGVWPAQTVCRRVAWEGLHPDAGSGEGETARDD
jgi:hypothetical protein